MTDSSVATIHKRIGLRWAVADSIAIAKRYLIAYIRVPELIVFTTVQPIMFVLLFRYVFGGAIQIPDVSYVDYLMPGIFVQTVVFGSAGTGIGLAEDSAKGLIERFRSLPMARSAVLVGRTLADLVRNVFVVSLMLLVGFLVGFRIHGGASAFLLAMILVLLFGYAFSWLTANIGLRASTAEATQAAIFPMLFPLTFASSAFVPVASMPTWLQVFARNQPVTVMVNATRNLALGTATIGDVVKAIAWIIAIVVAFAPLAVNAYRSKAV